MQSRRTNWNYFERLHKVREKSAGIKENVNEFSPEEAFLSES